MPKLGASNPFNSGGQSHEKVGVLVSRKWLRQYGLRAPVSIKIASIAGVNAGLKQLHRWRPDAQKHFGQKQHQELSASKLRMRILEKLLQGHRSSIQIR